MRRLVLARAVTAAVVIALSGGYPFAQQFSARLSGFQEMPANLSKGRSSFDLQLNKNAGIATYWLTYSGLSGAPTVANIQFGAMRGVMVVLCGGSGKPACPADNGSTTVKGAIKSADVQAITSQGVIGGDFGAFLYALSSDSAYINIHTLTFPDGELRGQIRGVVSPNTRKAAIAGLTHSTMRSTHPTMPMRSTRTYRYRD